MLLADGDAATADREYWARTAVKGAQGRASGGARGADSASGDGCHPLLKPGELVVDTDGESVAVGTVQVRACLLSFSLHSLRLRETAAIYLRLTYIARCSVSVQNGNPHSIVDT